MNIYTFADINECQINNHDCSDTQRCDNTIGSYTCIRLQSCGTGYTLNAETGHCDGSYRMDSSCRFVHLMFRFSFRRWRMYSQSTQLCGTVWMSKHKRFLPLWSTAIHNYYTVTDYHHVANNNNATTIRSHTYLHIDTKTIHDYRSVRTIHCTSCIHIANSKQTQWMG